MSKFLIIPDPKNISQSYELAMEYDFGYEYNDFFSPAVMDNSHLIDSIFDEYKARGIPAVTTMHGAFLDVLLFSYDSLICDISEKRVEQSIQIAIKIGAEGVVFHTNHNPCLESLKAYTDNWLRCTSNFLGKMAEKYPQINIYVENMFDNSPDMIYSLAKTLEGVKNFGICFDYAHATIFGAPVSRWIKPLSPFIKHMHINDNNLRDDQHLAVGSGSIDWNEFRGYFGNELNPHTILIEVTPIEEEKKSAEFLHKLGIL